jgi:hypothetical protein
MTEPTSGHPTPLTSADALPRSKKSSFIKALGEYKEIITIIVFFLGGVLFAFGYFATKQQLTQIKCLLNANVDLIQSKMNSSSLSQIMVQNLEESGALDSKMPLNQADLIKRNKLKEGANEIGRKLAEADALTAKALSKLKSGECIAD